MIKYNKRCKVCAVIKTDKKLLSRIYHCSFFVPGADETLNQIANDYKPRFGYKGLNNHANKHQFIDRADYTQRMLQHNAKKEENKAVRKAVQAADSIQSIIEKGTERLESGEITVSTDQLIRAAQVKLQDDAKQKDQNLMAASLAHFISGESQNKRVFVPTEDTNLLETNLLETDLLDIDGTDQT